MTDKTIRNRAIDFHNAGYATVNHDKMSAYRMLTSAVTVDSTMAHSWFWLGNACADMNMLPASIAAFRRLLHLPAGNLPGDADMELVAKATVNLGQQLQRHGDTEEAHDVTNFAIELLLADPELDKEGRAFAWTNLAQILSVQGKMDEACAMAWAGYEYDPTPITETGLALVLLMAGEYADGLKHFEARFAYALPHYLNFPYPRWDGNALDGTLFVAPDQGLGDTISFARFVPSAAARVSKLIFAVQPELLRMMTEAMRRWDNISVVPMTTIFPVADAWCPVMSLPVALGLSTQAIEAFVSPWRVPQSQTPIERGWKDTNARLHIGIAWAGAPANQTDVWRSIPVTQFLELFRVLGIALYGLQVGERVQDLHAAGMAGLVRDLSPWIRDAMDTAAIIRELDLVITCESFVGHLCGALDKTCWVLVSRRGGDWRIGRTREKPLWYGRHRLFRQGEDGEWGPVFRRVVEALCDRMGTSLRISGKGLY